MCSVRWGEFANAAPAMAAAGRHLLFQWGPGLGYLATVRPDGGPRVHPVCPVVHGDGLYVFVGNHSPKVRDLLGDARYALHAFPCDDVDDEFFVSGRVQVVGDAAEREAVYATYTAQGTHTSDDTLFELLIERALHAEYGPRPSWPPRYARWRADRPGDGGATEPVA